MTSQIPGKFVLQCTTKMSLSDRFTQYQKVRPEPSTFSDESAKTTSAKQASAVNRRPQQLLANRPSVQAAVGNLNKRSVKQRQGASNLKIRLNLHDMRGDGAQRDVLGSNSDQRGCVGRCDQFRRGRGRQSGCMGRPGAGVARGVRFEGTRGDFRGNRRLGQGRVARGGRSAFDEDHRGRQANRFRGGGHGSFQRGGRGWVRGLRSGRGDNLPISKEHR